MREILFRGKRKDGLEWFYGSYMEHYYSSRYGRVSAIFTNDDSLCQTYRIPVDPETVGQFTGVIDKNGKKVFDGDVIKAIASNPAGEDIEATVIVSLDDYELMWDIEHSHEIEVIGNIHDNPEMLEAK